MTELEFEKACRGTGSTVANEYAWGTTGIASGWYTLNNSGENTEVVSSGYDVTNGNALYLSTNTLPTIEGPLRVGIFAGTTGNTGRVTSGATYYGIMEMSGNLWEICVTVGNSTGRTFTGTHGNGVLATNGNADATTWPDIYNAGSSLRGGGINSGTSLLPVSDRSVATTGSGNGSNVGGRGVRTATVFAPAIGDTYGGGIIFYIDGTGQHGLISSTADQIQAEWGCYGTTITGADGSALGTGNQNTIDILAECSEAGIAAKLCDDLDEGGYQDWYLPSSAELNELYINRVVIGGFILNYYWSSTEYSGNYAWQLFFVNGEQSFWDKNRSSNSVRAIRSF